MSDLEFKYEDDEGYRNALLQYFSLETYDEKLLMEKTHELFEKVKDIILDMGFVISHEDLKEELGVIDDDERGIKNLVIDCEDPILILEQVIIPIPQDSPDIYKRLLQINRTLVHGAFVLNEEGTTLLFRDTLQIENLDRNELEGSIDALSLALAEYASELVSFARG